VSSSPASRASKTATRPRRCAGCGSISLGQHCRQTEAEEYYHADLIGLEAVLGDGTPVGRVRAIYDFGAGDTLELTRPGASPVMVPFTRAVVRASNLPPDGWCSTRRRDVRREQAMTWRATVLTIFPRCCRPARLFTRRQGIARGLWRLETVDIRDFARDKHRSSTNAPSAGGRAW